MSLTFVDGLYIKKQCISVVHEIQDGPWSDIYHHLSMQYNIIILYNMYKYVYISIRIIYTII